MGNILCRSHDNCSSNSAGEAVFDSFVIVTCIMEAYSVIMYHLEGKKSLVYHIRGKLSQIELSS